MKIGVTQDLIEKWIAFKVLKLSKTWTAAEIKTLFIMPKFIRDMCHHHDKALQFLTSLVYISATCLRV